MSLTVQIMITWTELADTLEHELETAVEVKDKPSLHRYIQLLLERTVDRRHGQC